MWCCWDRFETFNPHLASFHSLRQCGTWELKSNVRDLTSCIFLASSEAFSAVRKGVLSDALTVLGRRSS